jgi:hypothetical protein
MIKFNSSEKKIELLKIQKIIEQLKKYYLKISSKNFHKEVKLRINQIWIKWKISIIKPQILIIINSISKPNINKDHFLNKLMRLSVTM